MKAMRRQVRFHARAENDYDRPRAAQQKAAQAHDRLAQVLQDLQVSTALISLFVRTGLPGTTEKRVD
jgi:uncharacterized membrane protein